MESNPEKALWKKRRAFGIKSVDPLTGEESSVWDNSDTYDHDVDNSTVYSTKASSVVVDVDL